MFISAVSSSSISDIPENIFVCFLTFFLLFLSPISEAPHYNQINYIQCLLPNSIMYHLSVFFVIPEKWGYP